ncbi:MAG: caspase family protein [Acidobacteriota bacterium]
MTNRLWVSQYRSRILAIVAFAAASLYWTADNNGTAARSHTPATENSTPRIVVQSGHNKAVTTAVFGPDGRYIATGSGDNTVRIWETAAGRELRSLSGHSGAITALVWSSDGKQLASAGFDRTLRIWNVKDGAQLSMLSGDAIFRTIVFSPDGRKIACGLSDNSISVHDTATKGELFKLAMPAAITSIIYSDDGRLLAAGTADGNIKIIETAGGRPLRDLPKQTGPANLLSFSANGETLASAASDGSVRQWRIQNGREMSAVKSGLGRIAAMRTLNNGRIVLADANGKIRIIDAGEKRTTSTAAVQLSDRFDTESGMADISRDGQQIVFANGDGTAGVFSVKDGSSSAVLRRHTTRYYDVAFDPEDHWLAAAGSDNSVKLWDLKTGQGLPPLVGHTGYVTAVCFHPDGQRVVSSSVDGTIKIWDAVTSRLLRSLSGHKGSVSAIALGSGGNIMVSGATDRMLGIWDLRDPGKPIFVAAHDGEVTSVAVSPDERYFLTAGTDRSIKLWSAVNRSVVWTSPDKSVETASVTFSPDGKTIAAGGNDGTIRLLDAGSGTVVRSLTGTVGKIQSVSYSKDGKSLASSGRDMMVRIWDTATFQISQTLSGHSGTVFSADFSPNGGWIASGSDDGSVMLWKKGSADPALTLISGEASDEWLVVAGQGSFDGSPEAWNDLLWRFGNDTFDVKPVEVFFEEFYQPGLLADVYEGKKLRLPSSVNIASKDRRQPMLSLTAVGTAKDQPGSARYAEVTIDVFEAAPDATHRTGSGVWDMRLFRNGSLVRFWPGNVITAAGRAQLRATVSMVAGRNEITAYAFNGDNVKSIDSELIITGSPSLARRGRTFIVAIGIGKYSNHYFDLNYVAADASHFADIVKKAQAEIDPNTAVTVLPLLDEQATKQNILDAIRRLGSTNAAEGGEKTGIQPEDSVFIYFSGHGLSVEDRFYMIPHDMGYSGPRSGVLQPAALSQIKSHGISDLELEEAFRGVDAKNLLLIIDACNSGQALETVETRFGPMNSRGLAQFAYEKGMYILAASQGDEIAYVSADRKRSYLTYALLDDALKGTVADTRPTDGKLVLREWFDYATSRVPALLAEKAAALRKGDAKKILLEEEMTPVGSQRPRVFYRRQRETDPMVIARFDMGRQGNN